MKKFFLGFGYALSGVLRLIQTQRNAQFHLLATIVVLGLAFYTSVNSHEWALLLLCIGMVWTAEAMNTAIEFLADRVTKEKDPLIKAAKDVAAGGVLFAAIVAALVGLTLFLPRILAWI